MNGMVSYNHLGLDLSLMPGTWAPKSDFGRWTRLLEEPGFTFKGQPDRPQVVIPHKLSTLNILTYSKRGKNR